MPGHHVSHLALRRNDLLEPRMETNEHRCSEQCVFTRADPIGSPFGGVSDFQPDRFFPLYPCRFVSIRGFLLHGFSLSGLPPAGRVRIASPGTFPGFFSNRARIVVEAAPGKSPRESRQSCRNLGRLDRKGPLSARRTGAIRGLRRRSTGGLLPRVAVRRKQGRETRRQSENAVNGRSMAIA